MGGRLAHFAEKWEEITDNKWVLSIVRNSFRIPFIKIPPLSSVPIRMSQSSPRRDRKSSQQTGSGKGTESGNSRLLFPDIPCAKKERKVSFNIRPVFIKPLHRETSIQNGNSQIGKTSDETQRLGCLHRFNRCISTCVDTLSIQEVSSLRTRRSSISLFGPTVRNVPKSVNFLETDGRYCSVSTPTCHISFSIPRRLADKKSDSQPSDYSDKDLHSNYSKPRFSAKSQEVRGELHKESAFM